MTTAAARSHPNERSDLVAHSRAVWRGTRALLASNLSPAWFRRTDPLVRIICLTHDILKDTRKFQDRMRRGGGTKTRDTRHTGGGAWIALLLAREAANREIFEGSWDNLLPWLPKIAFSVVAAHHGELRRIQTLAEHRDAITHWLETHGEASRQLVGEAVPKCSFDVIIETLEKHLQQSDLKTDPCGIKTPPKGDTYFPVFFWCRTLLGCLGKADVASAMRQEKGEKEPDEFFVEPETCRLAVPEIEPSDNALNRLRTGFQTSLVEGGRHGPGIYRLKAPTGLGKTRAAMLWAQKQQEKDGRDCRLFYLAPTTAILNQVFEDLKVFAPPGKVLILHHLRQERGDKPSAEQEEDEKQRQADLEQGLDLDAGLLVTTFHRAIRLLGDLHKSGCASLSGLRGAIWIMDESQALSYRQFALLAPVWQALVDYTEATVLFMSATPQSEEQWALATQKLNLPHCPPPLNLLSATTEDGFTRNPLVNERRIIRPHADIRTLDDLSIHLNREGRSYRNRSLLILLNLARDARGLAEMLEIPPDFLITSYLRPMDIRQQLGEAADRLKSGEPIRMIATSIVQAGVDLDFDCGLVELNDLRDFRQGCGRVGRNLVEGRIMPEVRTFCLASDPPEEQPSWFRQRFKRVLKPSNRESVQAQIDMVEQGVHEVLRGESWTDADIDGIEAAQHSKLEKVFKYLRIEIGLSSGNYLNLLRDGASEQGFRFSSVRDVLIEDLGEDDGMFLVIFDSIADPAFQEWQRLGRERSACLSARNRGELSAAACMERVRSINRTIHRLIAPFAIRRPDVLRDYQQAQLRGRRWDDSAHCFVECHGRNYDVARGGYLFRDPEQNQADETSGVF
ncbi:MAG: DEAD/DEAH box helicase [Puniceicoccaceae bacterium]